MQDGVIKGTGNSRYLKSIAAFLTQYPTYEAFAAALAAGTLPIDLNGINETGWETLGTALNKANLLQDATAALYGLGSDAVPDDVLSYLGSYNLYWWKKSIPGGFKLNTDVAYSACTVGWSTGATGTDTIYYYDSISVDPTSGVITPTGTRRSVTVGYNSYTNAQILRGKYFYPNGNTSGKLTYAKQDGQVTRSNTGNYSVYIEGYVVSVKYVDGDFVEYVTSQERNTYPDNGESGDYYYSYLGIPFKNSIETTKLEIISYVGTGTYGESSPTTITFSSKPKLWGIFQQLTIEDEIRADTFPNILLWLDGITADNFYIYYNSNPDNVKVSASFSGTTVSFYCNNPSQSSANYQLNNSGVLYYAFAIL